MILKQTPDMIYFILEHSKQSDDFLCLLKEHFSVYMKNGLGGGRGRGLVTLRGEMSNSGRKGMTAECRERNYVAWTSMESGRRRGVLGSDV